MFAYFIPVTGSISMNEILNTLATCIERGKIDRNAPYPPDMKGQDGAAEMTARLLEAGLSAQEILERALTVGMNRVGDKFASGEAFIPDLLIAAKAMNAAMAQLKPYFDTGEAHHRGTVVIGTVLGDLHDIGKNIVRMVLEGDGWNVIDLGVNVDAGEFAVNIKKHPDCILAMSALLTTTMSNMESVVRQIRTESPATRIFIGGAPLNQSFSDRIGADGYFPEPHSFARFIAK